MLLEEAVAEGLPILELLSSSYLINKWQLSRLYLFEALHVKLPDLRGRALKKLAEQPVAHEGTMVRRRHQLAVLQLDEV